VFRFALHRRRQAQERQGTARIGVVVIGRNEGDRLLACLDSLKDEKARIVYVDSGSTDASVAEAEARGAEVVALDMAIPFTAARARNAGFRRLQELEPALDYVQFVDGDCAVADGWLTAAAEVLDSRTEVVAVSGRRREMHPQHSIYNRLADYEWDTPLGPVKWCGGDVLMRADVLAEVGGYDDQLIACEEPELCFRLRTLGWTVLRIEAPMTHHDADIRRFGQWWSRCRRTGYSYLQAATLHWDRPGRFLRSEIRSGLIWGILMPLLLLGCLLQPWLLLLFLGGCAVQTLRILNRRRKRQEASRFSLSFTFFTIFINLPIAMGMLRFLAYRLRGRESTLIEYK
jgi:GT2 family glycosyltransferase